MYRLDLEKRIGGERGGYEEIERGRVTVREMKGDEEEEEEEGRERRRRKVGRETT